ncbi:MAG: hypothetical protein J6B68_12475 [Lachnospiraceae bacterium]|nr:hypothetical protein [Lachnospiraceae bacterium]
MAKIYRRSTLVSGTKKKQQKQKRVRNIIMNFRVTLEEKDIIERRIRLSGLAKGDFFIQSCKNQKIITTGNIKTFDAIRESMKRIDEHLLCVHSVEELDEAVLVELRTILEMLDSVYGENLIDAGADEEGDTGE